MQTTIIIFLLFTQQAVEADRSGDSQTAREKNQTSLHLSVVSIILAVIAYVSLIVIVPILSVVVRIR